MARPLHLNLGIHMETARRLGAFSLVIAFVLFVFFERSAGSGLAWRGQVLAYGILFAILGIILLARYRSREKKTGRFRRLKDLLFSASLEKRSRRRKSRDRRAKDEAK